jgi:hypothetical protein
MLDRLIIQVEDYIFPQLSLDVWERVAYYILLRRTVVVDQNETTISVEELGQAGAMSGFKAREVLRSLNERAASLLSSVIVPAIGFACYCPKRYLR